MLQQLSFDIVSAKRACLRCLVICADRQRLLGILISQLCITIQSHASLPILLVDCLVLTLNDRPLTAPPGQRKEIELQKGAKL